MPRTIYPFKDNYIRGWSNYRKTDKAYVMDYVSRALVQHDGADEISCPVDGGIWQKIYLVNNEGKPYFSKSDVIYICCKVDFEQVPSHVMIGGQGYLSAHKLRKLSIKEILLGLLKSILRTAEVMIPIGSISGAPQLMDAMSGFQKAFSGVSDAVKPLLAPVLEAYQKSSAWVSEKIHFDLLQKLHKVGRIVVPEYNEYWIEQENQLASMSQRIFGDTTHLSTYVHLAEMIFNDLALAAGKNPDDARYEGMQHGADLMKKLRSNIQTYEANPALVWSFIMNETFGEGNPYIKEKAGLEGRDIFMELGALGKVVTDMKTVMNRLEVYNTELNKLELSGLTNKVSDLGNTLDNYFDENVRPVIQGIDKINVEQDKLLAKIKSDREKEERARNRSFLMATPPEELSGKDKKQQATQFTSLFSNAIDPSDDVSRRFRQDIESIIGAIYD